MQIQIAATDAEIMACFAVMAELRPQLAPEQFVDTVRRLTAQGGFQLVSLQDGGAVKAVAGIRLGEWLHRGLYLEIEDLVVTASDRSHGYGAALFHWLADYARARQCRQLQLVSGVAREAAHRFYLRLGMRIEAKYFSLDLD